MFIFSVIYVNLKYILISLLGYPCDFDGCESIFDNWTSLRRHKYLLHPTGNYFYVKNFICVDHYGMPCMTEHGPTL